MLLLKEIPPHTHQLVHPILAIHSCPVHPTGRDGTGFFKGPRDCTNTGLDMAFVFKYKDRKATMLPHTWWNDDILHDMPYLASSSDLLEKDDFYRISKKRDSRTDWLIDPLVLMRGRI